MKKRLLFVLDSLRIGGAEKSLVTLLNLIDYDLYDVDLQLMAYGGEFERFVPGQVNILKPLRYTESIEAGYLGSLRRGWLGDILARAAFSAATRLSQPDGIANTILNWRYTSARYVQSRIEYDAAIAYGQGLPTFYVATKVRARTKAAWVNAIYELKGKNKAYQQPYYERYNHIVTVSQDVKDLMSRTYPHLADRYTIIKDIIDADFIKKMAAEPLPIDTRGHSNILVTVARLIKDVKGYDILLDAARLLRDRGTGYLWLILGDGEYRTEMQQYIADHGLGQHIRLLGSVSNPYPYIASATIYVQTSRSEGYGLSIAEARLLNIPVVTTAYKGYEMQMVPGKNGIVTPIDSAAVADAIADLISDKAKRDAISQYQSREPKGNTDEVCKLYQLIDHGSAATTSL